MPRRSPLRLPIALCCVLLGGSGALPGAELAVIVARDALPAPLDEGTLRDLYLKKIFLDARGRKLVPVNLPADHPVRQAFSRALFHQEQEALQDYWNQRYFHGITPPYVLASQQAVVRFVAQTPGAIGYVLPCYLAPDVTPVLHLPLPAAGLDGQCPPPLPMAP
jgi:ABC-type phosphate transport system substrate-binding protein